MVSAHHARTFIKERAPLCPSVLAQLGHDPLEGIHLGTQIAHAGRGHFHGMGDLFRYTAHIPGVTVHFLRRGGLFLTGRSYGAHLIRRGQHHLLDALQSFSGLARQLGGGAHILHGFADKPVALGRAGRRGRQGLCRGGR